MNITSLSSIDDRGPTLKFFQRNNRDLQVLTRWKGEAFVCMYVCACALMVALRGSVCEYLIILCKKTQNLSMYLGSSRHTYAKQKLTGRSSRSLESRPRIGARATPKATAQKHDENGDADAKCGPPQRTSSRD